MGVWFGTVTASALVMPLGIIDGFVDTVKGTHHYFGFRVWQKLTRNKKTKEEIDEDLERQPEIIEKPIRYEKT